LLSQASIGVGWYALLTKQAGNDTVRPAMDGRARSHQSWTTVGDGTVESAQVYSACIRRHASGGCNFRV
jgi:hypothetical protein